MITFGTRCLSRNGPQRRGLGGEQTETKKTIRTVLSNYHGKKSIRYFLPTPLRGQTEPATRLTTKMLDFAGWRRFPSSRVRVRLHAKCQHDFTRDWECGRRTTEALNAPCDSKDCSSDEQPHVNYTTLWYTPFPAKPWFFFSFPIEVGNRGNWQGSQSEEGEGWVEITVERCDEELDHPAGHREGGQVEPKPELCGRQKCGETPVSRQRLEVSIAIRSRFWCLHLQLSFEPADGLLETLTAL
jgi:hypothetical protein